MLYSMILMLIHAANRDQVEKRNERYFSHRGVSISPLYRRMQRVRQSLNAEDLDSEAALNVHLSIFRGK